MAYILHPDLFDCEVLEVVDEQEHDGVIIRVVHNLHIAWLVLNCVQKESIHEDKLLMRGHHLHDHLHLVFESFLLLLELAKVLILSLLSFALVHTIQGSLETIKMVTNGSKYLIALRG